ncbi:MAG: DUF4124 domain-containing protein [Chromatiales bacterium]|nr:DUF4124 domain-containing protein [Chromatiales bacterium]
MLATALMAPASYAGNMYKWVDTNGRTHYGDRPTHASASQISFAKPAKTTSASPTPTQRDRLQLRRRLLRAYDMERNEKKIAEHRALVKKDKKHSQALTLLIMITYWDQTSQYQLKHKLKKQ